MADRSPALEDRRWCVGIGPADLRVSTTGSHLREPSAARI